MRRGSRLNRALDYYIGIPVLNASALVSRRGTYPETVRRIGVMANYAIGDTLLLSGPLQDLRATFPSQELVFFAAAPNVGAARLVPGIDRIELISVNRPWQAIRRLRSAQLDLMLDFTSWQRLTAFLTLYSGAKYTVGFRTPSQHRYRGYCEAVEHRCDRHELDNLRALTAAVGVHSRTSPRVVVPEGLRPEIVISGHEMIVFHPWPSGTRSWLREWPPENWLALAKELAGPGRIFVITGSPADQPRSQAICAMLAKAGLPAHVFTGHAGLEAVARLLVDAHLLVSVNTGIMHLGSILGTPTVSINGPSRQHRWGPVGPRSVGVDTPDGTGGFLHLGFEFNNNSSDSMQKIGVEHVLIAVQNLFAGLPVSNGPGRASESAGNCSEVASTSRIVHA